MDLPMTPTKRLLTEADRSLMGTSWKPHNSCVSDDLNVILQNVGSRVRKHVTEGYATHRLAAFVPATPFPSPEKPSSVADSWNYQTIFHSVNDTLSDVLPSPTRAQTSPSPSPKKRGRAELEEEISESELDADGDTGMESDDESITPVVTPSPSRPIKPMKKLFAPHHSLPQSIFHEQIDDVSESTESTAMQMDESAPDKLRWADMFNHEF